VVVVLRRQKRLRRSGKHLSSVLIIPAVALNTGHKKTSGAFASGGFSETCWVVIYSLIAAYFSNPILRMP